MINQYKSPKDKNIILINFCNFITSMLNTQKNREKPAGADEVYPIVVYALIKGNINKIKSNLNFIQFFRHKTRLEAAEDYYFTTISTALEFIAIIDSSKLTINDMSSFNLKLKNSQRAFREKLLKERVIRSNENEKLLIISIKKKNFELPLKNVEMLEIRNPFGFIRSTINKAIVFEENEGDGTYTSGRVSSRNLLKINLTKLYNEYFLGSMFDFPLFKLEKMFNDFRIVVLLTQKFVESYEESSSSVVVNGGGRRQGGNVIQPSINEENGNNLRSNSSINNLIEL